MELENFISEIRNEGFIVDCNKNPRGSNKWVHIFNPNCELIYRFPVEGSHKVDNFKYRIFKSGKKKLLYMDQFMRYLDKTELEGIDIILYNSTVLDLIKNIKCICHHDSMHGGKFVWEPIFELTTGKFIKVWDHQSAVDALFKYIELTRVNDEDFNLLLNSEDSNEFRMWIHKLSHVIPVIAMDTFGHVRNTYESLIYSYNFNHSDGSSNEMIGRITWNGDVKIVVNVERKGKEVKINSRAGEIITFGLQ